jgi:hypothetical protein
MAAASAAAPTKTANIPATMRAVQYDSCGGGAAGLKVTAQQFCFLYSTKEGAQTADLVDS